MATSTLPGVVFLDAANYGFGPYPPTFADILNSTLGNELQPGDTLDQAAQTLAQLMADFEADVTADTLTDSLPSGSVFGATTTALAAIGAEIDIADGTSAAIQAALDGLAIGFGVWYVFDTLLTDIEQLLQQFTNNILGVIGSLFGPSFGGGTAGGGLNLTIGP